MEPTRRRHARSSASGEGNAIAFWQVPAPHTPPTRALLRPPATSFGQEDGGDDADDEVLLGRVAQLQALIDQHGIVQLADHLTSELRSTFSVATVDAMGVCSPAEAIKANGGELVARSVVATLRATGEEPRRAPHPLRLCLQGHESHDAGCRCHWARFGKCLQATARSPAIRGRSTACVLPGSGMLASRAFSRPDRPALGRSATRRPFA